MSPQEKIGRPFLIALLLLSLALVLAILGPFLHPIIFAIVLAGLFSPVQERCARLLKGRRALASLAVSAGITGLIALPGLLLLTAMAAQGVRVLGQIRQWLDSGGLQRLMAHPVVAGALDWIEKALGAQGVSPEQLKAGLLAQSKAASGFLLTYGANALSTLAGTLSGFAIMLFVLFYLLRDGPELVKRLKELSPLRDEQDQRILDRVRSVSRSVVAGSFLTALAQGVVGGIGLALTGIPGLFWGSVMALASLIPVVGTALVWLPAVGWLLAMGRWQAALFLAGWCIVLVGSIDNFLRPFLMQGKGGLSPFAVFLGVLGGIKLFGLAGLLYGPLAVALFLVMLSIYRDEFRSELD